MKRRKFIDIITSFKGEKEMMPLHFKISLDDECFDPAVENEVLKITKENHTLDNGLLYNCETSNGSQRYYYNLKFEPCSNKWKLWRQ